MIDLLTLNQRLAEVVAEPRANVDVVAIIATIAVMLLLLLVIAAFSIASSRRESNEYIARDAEGKPYLVTRTNVSSASNPRRRLYTILALASFSACLISAYFVWNPFG